MIKPTIQVMTIDAYIAQCLPDIQVILSALRSEIKAMVPLAEETINYGIPTFKLSGKNIVHFAAFKNHIGFYPTPAPIVAFQDELAGYKQAKGSIQFPLNKPLPIELIKKMVIFRIRSIESENKI
jgi:uncharacterized protein YdhG (YjbR/CyaY superfamily)